MDQHQGQPPQPGQPQQPQHPSQYPPPPPPSAAEQFRGYVMAKLKSGTPKSDVVAALVNRGIDQGQAIQLVNSVDVGVVQPAMEVAVTGGGVLFGAIGAALAAVVGGLVWGLIAGKTGYEIGYLAWGIGLLCGFAVVLASGGKKGTTYQMIAVAGSVLGIFIGKYFTFYFVLKKVVGEEVGAEAAATVSLFSADVFQFFMETIGELVSGWDLLWVGFAVVSAWAIPKVGGDEPELDTSE